jgi:Tfp pilus assembly protein PilF
MRWISLFAAALFAAFAAVPALAQGWATGFNMVLDNCQDRTLAPDVRIKMCTELIHSNLLGKGIMSEIYDQLGVAYVDKGDFDDGLKNLNIAISDNADNPWSYHNLGYMYEKEGKPEQAAPEFLRAGMALLKNGKCDDAVKEFSFAVLHDPKLAAAYYGTGLCEQRQGKKQLGQADIDQALKLDPSIANTGDWPSND